jgi:hypothetical protein
MYFDEDGSISVKGDVKGFSSIHPLPQYAI